MKPGAVVLVYGAEFLTQFHHQSPAVRLALGRVAAGRDDRTESGSSWRISIQEFWCRRSLQKGIRFIIAGSGSTTEILPARDVRDQLPEPNAETVRETIVSEGQVQGLL